MSNAIIKVQNLGKRYRISHQQTGMRYEALRDVLTQKAKSLFVRDRTPGPGQEDFWALKDVSFEIKPGEKVGVIGRNGAGKSTLLKLLSRITEPTQGRIEIQGRVASLLEVGTGFHPELTGRENIFLNGAILGMGRQEIKSKFDEIVAFSEVEKFLDTPVKRYSSGMYVRLAFAVAAHLEPEILLVDEVLAVGDAQFQKKCLGKMDEVSKQQGRTIIFVSHNMSAVENLCTKCYVLENNGLVLEDTPKKAIDFYLNQILPNLTNERPLADRTDRSGSQAVKFTGFFLEDSQGRRINSAQSGMDVIMVFRYHCRDTAKAKYVDFGISFSDNHNVMLSVLYSSYTGDLFKIDKNDGEIRFKINNLFYAAGRYRIGARIVVHGVESDWPQDGIGFIDIEGGDFYGTGSSGFDNNAPVLLKGVWDLN